MKEQTLLNYFLNTATSEELAEDLKGSQQKSSYDTTSVYVEAIDNGTIFTINKTQLIKLCDDVINNTLTTNDLNTIAFAIITSDFFTWDSNAEDAPLIETVLNDWDNPEIGYDLTLKNILLWKEYLQSGNYKFDEKEIKAKFRNDRK